MPSPQGQPPIQTLEIDPALTSPEMNPGLAEMVQEPTANGSVADQESNFSPNVNPNSQTSAEDKPAHARRRIAIGAALGTIAAIAASGVVGKDIEKEAQAAFSKNAITKTADSFPGSEAQASAQKPFANYNPSHARWCAKKATEHPFAITGSIANKGRLFYGGFGLNRVEPPCKKYGDRTARFALFTKSKDGYKLNTRPFVFKGEDSMPPKRFKRRILNPVNPNMDKRHAKVASIINWDRVVGPDARRIYVKNVASVR